MLAVEDIRPIAIFSSIPDEALAEVARLAADIRLLAREYAYYEGDEAGLYVVISGRLEVTKMIDGQERRLGERAAGKILGEIPLVYGTRFPSNGRAVEPSRVMYLNSRVFHDLVQAHPAFRDSIALLAKERIGGLQGIAAEPFKAQATVVGDPFDESSVTLRRFLDRNHISYDWLLPEAKDLGERWGEPHVAAGDLPAIRCADGTRLRRPEIRRIAEKMGLQTVPLHQTYDTVIIGGGPAGLAAAVYGASEGLRTLVIEREAPGGQAGTSSRIENYLGFPSGISGDELADRAHRQARRLGAEIITTRHSVALEPGPAEISVTLDGGDLVRGRTAIIATGVSWRRIPIEGFDRYVGKGVYYGTARSDARIAQGQSIHLIGAGNSAGQAAMFLSNHAETVTLLVRGESLEKGMSRYLIDQIRSRQNIRVALRSEIIGVAGRLQLEEVTIHDSETGQDRTERSGGVFVFIGADAETGWLHKSILRDPRGYVLTGTNLPKDAGWSEPRDPYLLESSMPGTFACGDVRFSPVKRVAAAVGEGSMAIAFIHQYLSTLGRASQRA